MGITIKSVNFDNTIVFQKFASSLLLFSQYFFKI